MSPPSSSSSSSTKAMAVASSGGRAELPKQCRERETSPERTKVWMKPKQRATERKVPVVYYLSRNGQLEHPHFTEVPLSSSADALYLRDVINRLNNLRGRGMATMYSWSSKRVYKNGFVWQDLSEDDFIYPAHGHEYILKGSEVLRLDSSPRSQETILSSSSSDRSRDDSDSPLAGREKKTSWNSLDLNEYKVYKTNLVADSAAKAATDASTQTDDHKQRRRSPPVPNEQPQAELGSDEISPPPLSSSPETLDTLLKSDGRGITVPPEDEDRTVGSCPRGRMRASTVLINLVSCGSISVKEHGPRLSLMSQYKRRLMPRGARDQAAKETDGRDVLTENPSIPVICVEDKEYFSGSLVEIKNKGGNGGGEFRALKRSSSCNADRSSRMEELLGKETQQGARSKCIPRKPKSVVRKESNAVSGSRGAHGSKRINDAASSVLKAEIPTSQE